MVRGGEGHRGLSGHVVFFKNGLIGEIVKGPVIEVVRIHKAVGPPNALLVLGPVRAQDDAEEVHAGVLGGGDQAVPRHGVGPGLDAVYVGVVVFPAAADEKISVVQLPLVGHVGGRDGVGAGVADGHKHRVLQRRLGDEVQVPGGGVMLGVVVAVGIHEMGVLTAQLLGFGVHPVHEAFHGAGDLFRQNGPGLVGGDHHQAVEQLLHRQNFPRLNAGGAAVLRQALQSRGGGGNLLTQLQPPLVDGLQHQKAGHDLGEAGRVELVVLVLRVDHRAGFPVHQQGGLRLNRRRRHPGRLDGNGQLSHQQKGQEKN